MMIIICSTRIRSKNLGIQEVLIQIQRDRVKREKKRLMNLCKRFLNSLKGMQPMRKAKKMILTKRWMAQINQVQNRIVRIL